MLKEVTVKQEDLLSGAPGGALARVEAPEESGPARVAHVVDFYNRYPGDVVTFFTRVETQESLSDLTLRISIPEGLVLGDFRASPEFKDGAAYVEVDEGFQYLVWSLDGELPAGNRYEYQAEARVEPRPRDVTLESRAALTNKVHEILAEETVTFVVLTKGRYLPELYEQDELMARFLMLFESFWAPIEAQVGSIAHYFNPEMTPVRFLPWLASWLGLELDDRFPEERQRRLIHSAVWLFRRRGTPWALKEYLEIYTGGQVRIIEHRAHDFRLGPENRLGLGVALGIGNRPHTFTVILRLPPIPAPAENEREHDRLELERRRAIEAIIDSYKPAHTSYNLRIV